VRYIIFLAGLAVYMAPSRYSKQYFIHIYVGRVHSKSFCVPNYIFLDIINIKYYELRFYFLSLCIVHISGINEADGYLLLSIIIDYY